MSNNPETGLPATKALGPGAGHALMRLAGSSFDLTLQTLFGQEPGARTLYGENVDAPGIIREVLHGEYAACQTALAPFHLPMFYFQSLVAAVAVAGPVPVARSIKDCAQVLVDFEEGLPSDKRLAPSLIPFAEGFIQLALAQSLREEKRAVSEMLFGQDGPLHAAALRQVMNPTQNRQAHRRRASLEKLVTASCPMAVEAWRAFEAWCMVYPDWESICDRASCFATATDPMPSKWTPEFHKWVEARVVETGQAFLSPILPKEVETTSVFASSHPPTPEQAALLTKTLRDGLQGRCTARPDAVGTMLSPWHCLAGWRHMVGPEEALKLMGEFTTDLVLFSRPFSLFGRPESPAPEGVWVFAGLKQLARSFRGTPEFPMAYAIYAGCVSEWNKMDRYGTPRGAEGPHAPVPIIVECVYLVPQVLALLDEQLPLEQAPWVDQSNVVSTMANAMLSYERHGLIGPALKQVLHYADIHQIDPTG